MSAYTIREVAPRDDKELAQIIRGVFVEHDAPQAGTVYSDPTTDHLYEYFQTENALLFVGEVDGQVVGCGGIYPTEGLPADCVEFVKFYIKADARGLGLGRAILEQSLTFAINKGYRKVYLESLPHYAKAIGMYERVGFQQLSGPMGASGHPTCNVWMLWEAR